ncbi:MAG TPA: rod shape-determining protein [Candidatus Limiplasma sp.]|jgi:rod shape-determining protein MreB|nr:rod shape-determining protein [Candidatus Limiplasma sp.]
MGFAAHDLGIDLGTSNTLVYVGGKNIVVNEPTIVVVESTNERRVRAVGDDAKIMLGRTTEGVMAIRPMREGVITDFDMTRILLQYFTRKAIGSSYLLKPRLFLTYPCSISSIEQRAVMEAAKCAGGRKIFLVEKPFASALGSGLPVFEPNGCMIVDIGGGTTDVSVISLGGVVLSHSIRVGGVKMDEAIINFIKREFNILIGDRTAEEVKLDLGAALPIREERRARIRGRDMVTNLPQTTEITSTQIYQAIHEPCLAILSAIKWVLERTPPELAADVMHNGIYITGGGALLYGMDQMIASELGIPVLLAKEPMDCAALGLGNIIENFDLLQHLGRVSFLKQS